MAAVAHYRFKSVSGDQTSRQIGFIVKDADDDIDALDAVELTAPATYDGLTRSSISIDEIRWPDLWEATATYSRVERKPPETGEMEYSFDVSLEQQKVLQSYSTVNQYVASGGTATNFYKAINVDETGSPQGVDVRVPTSAFQISYYPAVAVVTTDYQKTVRNTVGKVNSATFRGHAAGEVMFVGCSGRARNVTDWELTFRFEVRPNQTGITIGNISGIAVNGWDYLWVYGERATDESSNRYIKKPAQVNVERIYERADFAAVLGIS